MRRGHARRRPRRGARRARSAGRPPARRHGRRRAGRRPQRDPPPRRRAGPRRRPAGPLRGRVRRGRQGRRADGEERQRLRPVPPARRVAGHARVPRRRDPADQAACRAASQWFVGAADPFELERRAVPADVGAVGRHVDVGAAGGRRARRRGAGRRAPADGHRRPATPARPVGGGRCRRPSSPPSGATSWPRWASGSCTTRRRRRPGPSTRRSPSCTAGSRSASTPSVGSTRASIRSMGDRPYVDGPPGPAADVWAAARAAAAHWGLRPPVLVRLGMNGIFNAGGRHAARRAGRPPTRRRPSSWRRCSARSACACRSRPDRTRSSSAR